MSKAFNSTVARIRNSNGEFEALPALRGLDSYQLAVNAGFEGTEEDWMNSIIGDGWVGAFQTVDAEQKNIKAKQTEIETLIGDLETHVESSIDNLEKEVDSITPGSIGAAAANHNHAYSEVGLMASQVRNITISDMSVTPSGGNDGDLWFRYE